ncbi:heavy-metal-associated domain-containing protein [Kerstersia similis]|uniref:heavy-metal-associated domain-containing protein n=1 Tax=Kerstersia similis TaxID=206505 RepID=UPI0039F0FAA2
MTEFQVPRMKCGGCAGTITAAIKAVDPQAVVETDPASKRVSVQSTVSEDALRAALENAGYPAQ